MNEIQLPNDILVATLSNPNATTKDFLANNINADNTSLLSPEEYKETPLVKKIFTDDKGVFNNKAYEQAYALAYNSYVDLLDNNLEEQFSQELEYSPSDRFKPAESKSWNPEVTYQKLTNPLLLAYGLEGINRISEPTISRKEAAQWTPIYDPKTGKFLEDSAESLPLYQKIFGDTLVYATWESDGEHTDLMTGETVKHRKGEWKTNKDGNFYTEYLGDREVLDHQVVNVLDILTSEDSAWNKADFMDADGLDKSVFGTVMKTAVSIAPYLIPVTRPYWTALTTTFGLASVLPTFYKSIESIFMGKQTNTPITNQVENWFRKFEPSKSEHASENFFSIESLGGLVVDTLGQLYQQRAVAKAATSFLKEAPSMKNLDTPEAEAAFKAYWKKSNALASGASLGYMGLISAANVYNDTLLAGYDKRTAGVTSLLSAGALFGVMNFNTTAHGIGTWFLDESVGFNKAVEGAAVRKVVMDKAKPIDTALKSALKGDKFKLANTLRNTKNSIAESIDSLAREGVYGPGLSHALRASLSEGLEEVSEEVIQDTVKGMIDAASYLGMVDLKGSFGGWSNVFSAQGAKRYFETFVGGAIGGAIFDIQNSIENGTLKQLSEQPNPDFIDLVVKGHADDLRNEIQRCKKFFNDKLSANKLELNGKEFYLSDDTRSQADVIVLVLNEELDRAIAVVNEGKALATKNPVEAGMRYMRKDIYEKWGLEAYASDQFMNTLKEFAKAKEEYLALQANKSKKKTDKKSDTDKESTSSELDTSNTEIQSKEEEILSRLNKYSEELKHWNSGKKSAELAAEQSILVNQALINPSKNEDFLELTDVPLLSKTKLEYAMNVYNVDYKQLEKSTTVEDKALKEKIDKEWSSSVPKSISKENLLVTLPLIRKAYERIIPYIAEDLSDEALVQSLQKYLKDTVDSPVLLTSQFSNILNNSKYFNLSDRFAYNLADSLNKDGAFHVNSTNAEDIEKAAAYFNLAAIDTTVNVWTAEGLAELTNKVNQLLVDNKVNVTIVKEKEEKAEKKSDEKSEKLATENEVETPLLITVNADKVSLLSKYAKIINLVQSLEKNLENVNESPLKKEVYTLLQAIATKINTSTKAEDVKDVNTLRKSVTHLYIPVDFRKWLGAELEENLTVLDYLLTKEALKKYPIVLSIFQPFLQSYKIFLENALDAQNSYVKYSVTDTTRKKDYYISFNALRAINFKPSTNKDSKTRLAPDGTPSILPAEIYDKINTEDYRQSYGDYRKLYNYQQGKLKGPKPYFQYKLNEHGEPIFLYTKKLLNTPLSELLGKDIDENFTYLIRPKAQLLSVTNDTNASQGYFLPDIAEEEVSLENNAKEPSEKELIELGKTHELHSITWLKQCFTILLPSFPLSELQSLYTDTVKSMDAENDADKNADRTLQSSLKTAIDNLLPKYQDNTLANPLLKLFSKLFPTIGVNNKDLITWLTIKGTEAIDNITTLDLPDTTILELRAVSNLVAGILNMLFAFDEDSPTGIDSFNKVMLWYLKENLKKSEEEVKALYPTFNKESLDLLRTSLAEVGIKLGIAQEFTDFLNRSSFEEDNKHRKIYNHQMLELLANGIVLNETLLLAGFEIPDNEDEEALLLHKLHDLHENIKKLKLEKTKAEESFDLEEVFSVLKDLIFTNSTIKAFDTKYINLTDALASETINPTLAFELLALTVIEDPIEFLDKYKDTMGNFTLLPRFDLELVIKQSVFQIVHSEDNAKIINYIHENSENASLIDRPNLNNLMFILGSAGSGKTTIIPIITSIVLKYDKDVKFMLTASAEQQRENLKPSKDILKDSNVDDTDFLQLLNEFNEAYETSSKQALKQIAEEIKDRTDYIKKVSFKSNDKTFEYLIIVQRGRIHRVVPGDLNNLALNNFIEDYKKKHEKDDIYCDLNSYQDFSDLLKQKISNNKAAVFYDEATSLNPLSLYVLNVLSRDYETPVILLGDTTQSGYILEVDSKVHTYQDCGLDSYQVHLTPRLTGNIRAGNSTVLDNLKNLNYLNDKIINEEDYQKLIEPIKNHYIKYPLKYYINKQQNIFRGFKKYSELLSTENTDSIEDFLSSIEKELQNGKKLMIVHNLKEAEKSELEKKLFNKYLDISKNNIIFVSQDLVRGSESDYVLLYNIKALPDSSNIDLDKKTIYTLISRAKNFVASYSPKDDTDDLFNRYNINTVEELSSENLGIVQDLLKQRLDERLSYIEQLLKLFNIEASPVEDKSDKKPKPVTPSEKKGEKGNEGTDTDAEEDLNSDDDNRGEEKTEIDSEADKPGEGNQLLGKPNLIKFYPQFTRLGFAKDELFDIKKANNRLEVLDILNKDNLINKDLDFYGFVKTTQEPNLSGKQLLEKYLKRKANLLQTTSASDYKYIIKDHKPNYDWAYNLPNDDFEYEENSFDITVVAEDNHEKGTYITLGHIGITQKGKYTCPLFDDKFWNKVKEILNDNSLCVFSLTAEENAKAHDMFDSVLSQVEKISDKAEIDAIRQNMSNVNKILINGIDNGLVPLTPLRYLKWKTNSEANKVLMEEQESQCCMTVSSNFLETLGYTINEDVESENLANRSKVYSFKNEGLAAKMTSDSTKYVKCTSPNGYNGILIQSRYLSDTVYEILQNPDTHNLNSSSAYIAVLPALEEFIPDFYKKHPECKGLRRFNKQWFKYEKGNKTKLAPDLKNNILNLTATDPIIELYKTLLQDEKPHLANLKRCVQQIADKYKPELEKKTTQFSIKTFKQKAEVRYRYVPEEPVFLISVTDKSELGHSLITLGNVGIQTVDDSQGGEQINEIHIKSESDITEELFTDIIQSFTQNTLTDSSKEKLKKSVAVIDDFINNNPASTGKYKKILKQTIKSLSANPESLYKICDILSDDSETKNLLENIINKCN